MPTSHLRRRSTADQQRAWAFGRRVLLFLSPLFLVGLVAELTLWRTGDGWPSSYALRKQRESSADSLYGRDFLSQQFNLYKLAGIKAVRPDVLVIGTSRVMQLRDLAFTPINASFYNAGGMVHTVADLEGYVRLVENGQLSVPRVLIVGIEPWWVKGTYGSEITWLGEQDDTLSLAGHVEAYRAIIRRGRMAEFLGGMIAPRVGPYGDYTIGSMAERTGGGFRRDGSWQYPPQEVLAYLEAPRFFDRERPPVIERIRNRNSQFSLPATFDPVRSGRVQNALASIRQRGAEVWAFMPPFSAESLAEIEAGAEYNEWWAGYTRSFAGQLRHQGIHVIQVAAPRDYDLDDRYMWDGFHPGEVYMAHVVLRMVEQAPPSSLLRQIDVAALKSRIGAAPVPLAFEIPVRNGMKRAGG